MSIEILQPPLVTLYEYWDSKRQGRRFPSRQDIDPSEIPQLLPSVFLVDIDRDPLRFRYRLAGAEVDAIHNQSLTGKPLSAITSTEVRGLALRLYRAAVERRAPVCEPVRVLSDDGRYWHFELLLLPLGGADSAVEMLLGGAVPL